MEFIQELKKFGLKDKEAAVYLASLELGPAPVQNIARKAKVVRATTYVILEDLMQKGLITHYKEGKKTLFSAEPPLQLNRLLEKQEEEIKRQKEDLTHFLPELQAVIKAEGNRATVRYFEGKEGLRAIRQEIVMYSQPGEILYNFTPIDYIDAIFPENSTLYYKQRVSRGIQSRTILSTSSEKLKKQIMARMAEDRTDCRFIPPKLFPVGGGMTIFRDRIAMGTYTGKITGLIIENGTLANMMRKLFDLAWVGAETIDAKE
jgi:sugar-specific transcriptional regulator TrmB